MIDFRKIFNDNARSKIMYGLSFLPSPFYLKLFYFSTTGKRLNLKNPVGYNEKLQWLKLHNQNTNYSSLVDKIAVKDIINKKLGPGYTIKTLGYWDSFDKIDFSSLPESFVLKCNHDSGSTKIIKNKSKLNQNKLLELQKFFNNRLKKDFFYAGREYPYKGIKPYIMAEEFIENKNSKSKNIEDYKFFCFNGIPKILYVATDRFTDLRWTFFDMNFKRLNIINHHPNSSRYIPKPKNFDTMIEIATKLSKGIKNVRIDLYEIDNKIYFGEYTFFHGGGFRLFFPEEWELKLGKWLNLESDL